jgi:hypothetical protein
MPPEAYAIPKVFISGVRHSEPIPDLTSLSVHISAAQATAEVRIVGGMDDVPSNRAEIEAKRLTIWLSPKEEIFSGWLTGVETRMLPSTGHTTALFAAGTAPGDSPGEKVHLRFGAEIESGSVRRRAQSLTAHCVTGARGLRWGSRIDLTTLDACFDGTFNVGEIWYRFDAASGLKVEFTASGELVP